MFHGDVSVGESDGDLIKDIEYTGHEIDVQFSCFLTSTTTTKVPDLEIFGKVFISQIDEEGNERDEFSFNLIKNKVKCDPENLVI